MTKHYNPTLADTAAKRLSSKNGQFLGDEVLGPYACIDISKPDTEVIGSVAPTTTGAGTVVVTPSGKDTFLSSILLSYVKNVACDIATGSITVTCNIDGTSRTIASSAVLTLTAERDTVQVIFNEPIKLDRGATMSVSGTFTAGALSRSVQAFGFFVETTTS